MPDRYVLVLAGGRGERFWPWSRPERPKQLLPLASGGRMLLAATFERARRVVSAPEHVIVMTAMDLRDACRTACPGATVVGEPVARNTAPAIAAATAGFVPRDGALAVMPADHAIDDVDAFVQDLGLAFEITEREPMLATFGVRPSHPDTNFGYVRRGAKLRDRVHRAAHFTEKPDRARAEEYVASGEYGWNSGIFVWRRSTFFAALEASRPAIAAPFRNLEPGTGDVAEFERRLADTFPALESISVDYAVLEHAPNVIVIDPRFDWDDLGSWNAWARRQPRDERGNVVHGDAIALDCDGCVVVGEGGLASAVGLRDMVVVVANGDALTCRLDETERVRQVSEAVRKRSRS